MLAGYGAISGGEFNYIAVGMMAAHYGNELGSLAFLSVGWNGAQYLLGDGVYDLSKIGQGSFQFHNIRTMAPGAFWAGYGWRYYHDNR